MTSCLFRSLLISALISPLFVQNGAVAEGPAKPVPTVADYAYGTDSPTQRLNFWQVESDEPTPVAILIHSGGFLEGDKNDYDAWEIQQLLDKGISVVATNYRLIPEAMQQDVKPPVKACMHDAARAIQTVRAKAKDWNIDPQRVGVTGSSAGACICLWLALHDDLADPSSSDLVARQSTHVKCVSAYRAQTTLDPVEFREWISNADYGGQAFGFYGNGLTSKEAFELLLKNRETLLPWIMEYSPIKHVSKNAPPIFLLYPNQKTPPVVGGSDPAPAHAAINGVMLAERLKEYGTEIIVNYPGHEDPNYATVYDFLIPQLKGD